MPPLSHQIARFGIVGVLATATHVAVGLGLHEGFGVAAFWANCVAFSTAVFVTYIGNLRWTFELAGAHRQRFPKFLAVALLGLLLNQIIVYGVVDAWGGAYGIALALAVTVVPALTFALNRAWVFRAKD